MATKLKNIPFVGGDTMEFSFDFGTKVSGSMVECPMKLYYGGATSISSPSNITGNESTGFMLVDTQSWGQAAYDYPKSLDNNPLTVPHSSNGAITQLMVELDLSPLCTALFGGSNSAMKAAIKSFQLDTWGKGSGANGGVLTNNFVWQVWWNGNSPKWGAANWPNWYGGHTSPSIAESKSPWMSQSDCVNLVNSSNKIYILLWTYASDGTIPSEVDLDYINIKLQFARVPDAISPLSVAIPTTWSILIKGFSPTWDNTDTTQRYLWQVCNSLTLGNSNYEIQWYQSKFVFINWDGNSAEYLYSDSLVFKKFQAINFLLEQTTSGLRMRILINGATVKKYILNTTRNFAGNKFMAILQNVANGMQADAFLNSIVFLPNKNFDDDTEAEAVLRGTTQVFENDELLPPDLQNGTQQSSGQYSGHGNCANVLPNNQYEFKYSGNLVAIEFFQLNNKGQYIKQDWYGSTTDVSIVTFTTLPTTTVIWIKYYDPNADTGKYISWSNCSLKLKM